MNLALSFPFALGIVAAFNPCGFAMLPAYLSYFLGLEGTDGDTPKLKSILHAMLIGLVLTAGFVVVFGTFGILFSLGLSQQTVSSKTGYVTIAVGVLMVPLGIAMLSGRNVSLKLPKMSKGTGSRELSSVFMFGVSYAVVSLSCTIGIFIAGISSTFTTQSFADGVANFVAYAVGMGAVITFLTISLAMAKSNIARDMRRVLPYVNRVSGFVLILSGFYLVNYGVWELRVIDDPTTRNVLVDRFQEFQTAVNNWINVTTPSRIGVLAVFGIAGALLVGWLDAEPDRVKRRSLGITYLLAYLVIEIGFNQGEFVLFPILRFVANWPARIANWITDPLRAGVPMEIAFVALVAWWGSRRLQRRIAADSTPLDQRASV